MIESPFTFFQVQTEGVLVNALETMQTNFGKAPERFDAIDVRVSFKKFPFPTIGETKCLPS